MESVRWLHALMADTGFLIVLGESTGYSKLDMNPEHYNRVIKLIELGFANLGIRQLSTYKNL